MTLYILTREYNAHDQYGSYFISAWVTEPTADELRRIIPWASPEYVEHLRKGGGRLGEEESWYNLDVVEAGTHFGYAATP